MVPRNTWYTRIHSRSHRLWAAFDTKLIIVCGGSLGGSILNRIYGVHINLYISLFLLLIGLQSRFRDELLRNRVGCPETGL